MFGVGSSSGLLYLALIVLFVLAVFLICRELVCWYFKFNQISSTLTKIEGLLRAQAGK